MDLNKSISIPIAILIIVVLAALVGGIAVWKYREKPVEEEIPEEKRGDGEVENKTKYIACEKDSDCKPKKVAERTVFSRKIPLYICINQKYVNSDFVTKSWAENNDINLSDMLEQECVCRSSFCKIVPRGIIPPPK